MKARNYEKVEKVINVCMYFWSVVCTPSYSCSVKEFVVFYLSLFILSELLELYWMNIHKILGGGKTQNGVGMYK